MTKQYLLRCALLAFACSLLPGQPAFGQWTASDDMYDRGFGRNYPASAANMNIDFHLGYLYGDTTYHIADYVGTSGIESELEFPLQAPLIGATVGFGRSNRRWTDSFTLQATFLRNAGDGFGKMKDSDWLTDDIDISLVGAPNPGKDIYSESDIKLKARMADLRMGYTVHPSSSFSITPLIGVQRLRYAFDVLNVNQVGYGPYAPSYTGSALGKALEYEITYELPYVGAEAAFTGDTFFLGLNVLHSPRAAAEDRDDHILRYKLSMAKTDGIMNSARLTTEWAAGRTVAIGLSAAYMRISTTGDQTQVFYAGPFLGSMYVIRDKISSSQSTAHFTLSFRF